MKTADADNLQNVPLRATRLLLDASLDALITSATLPSLTSLSVVTATNPATDHATGTAHRLAAKPLRAASSIRRYVS